MPTGTQESAIVLANGLYPTPYAKTAHGLVRDSSRYRVLAVVDPSSSGDAGELLDGKHRSIPLVGSVRDFLDSATGPPDVCVVGVATEGGTLPSDLRQDLVEAARTGMTLVGGLHQLLSDDEELSRLASQSGGEIIDLRRPRPVRELTFWSGEILKLRTPRIAVLGTAKRSS